MSMSLVFLIFWLVMTVGGCLIWRSGDRIGGRSIALTAAINAVSASGIWLVSLGMLWSGYALVGFSIGVWTIVFCRIDRAVLRVNAPVLVLAGAAIAAIVLTELASWMGATREVILALLVLLGATTVVFLAWTAVSTFRVLSTLRARRG